MLTHPKITPEPPTEQYSIGYSVGLVGSVSRYPDRGICSVSNERSRLERGKRGGTAGIMNPVPRGRDFLIRKGV